MRLDTYLVDKEIVESRNKAQTLIKEGLISINGNIIKKSSYKVEQKDSIKVGSYKKYVSRSAFKLLYFLEELSYDLKDMVALDIGSSTGGFTQVLLEFGVKEVSAVDVGVGQLHKSLLEDKRVLSHENCDIREFSSQKVFDIVVSDVAFISLDKILQDVNRLANNIIILLFKPQFEVGREAKRDKNGVVQDKKTILKSMQRFEDNCMLQGWKLILKSPSKLSGKDGNLEYCYCFER